MIVKLLTEHHLEFLSLKGGCRGSSESTLVKMSNCWKSHAAAHFLFLESLLVPSSHADNGPSISKSDTFICLRVICNAILVSLRQRNKKKMSLARLIG